MSGNNMSGNTLLNNTSGNNTPGNTSGGTGRTIYTAVQLADPDRPVYTGVPVVMDWVKQGRGICVSHEVLRVSSAEGVDALVRVARYEFAGMGRVVHVVPNVSAREGLDEMFRQYQVQGIPFRRFRMHTGKGLPHVSPVTHTHTYTFERFVFCTGGG